MVNASWQFELRLSSGTCSGNPHSLLADVLTIPFVVLIVPCHVWEKDGERTVVSLRARDPGFPACGAVCREPGGARHAESATAAELPV